jgi:DNA-binding NarL/FixJ family response regulator
MPRRRSAKRGDVWLLRVGIVDDHPVFRLGVRQALSNEPGITVVWDTGGPAEAVRLAAEIPVDIVLLDLNLGDKTMASRLANTLRSQHPEVTLVIISALLDDRLRPAVPVDGAAGYLGKHLSPYQLSRALRDLRGGSVRGLPPDRRPVADQRAGSASGQESGPGHEDRLLTRREREVLGRIRVGNTNREIAVLLGISQTTVNKHVHQILAKLGVRNRAQAAARSALRRDPGGSAHPEVGLRALG